MKCLLKAACPQTGQYIRCAGNILVVELPNEPESSSIEEHGLEVDGDVLIANAKDMESSIAERFILTKEKINYLF